MKITKATRLYEAWLASFLVIVFGDLKKKHTAMASDLFIFFRATYYRWAQLFAELCKDLCDAPIVLAVGDLHIENFGTWRDILARLIWGINDFDEAYWLPYTNDLARLATSANLALKSNRLNLSVDSACEYILAGYRKGLECGGEPFVLEEDHPELRKMAMNVLRDPAHFWAKMDQQPSHRGKVPPEVTRALTPLLPEKGLKYSVLRRQAGAGSLGRERYTAVADWKGGRFAVEAKALAPSASVFAAGRRSRKILYQQILDNAVRCKDPYVQTVGDWIVRRLSPSCSRIELSTLPEGRNERILLEAMGFETANIHLGTPGAREAILADLKKRPKGWLRKAVEVMTDATRKDQKDWARKYDAAKDLPQ